MGFTCGLGEAFRIRPAEAENYHRRRPGKAELEEVFRLESERGITNDWVVRYDNRFFQLREPRTGKGQGGGLPVAGRKDRDRLSGKNAGLAGDRRRAVTVADQARPACAVSRGGLRFALNAVRKPDRRATLRPPLKTERKRHQGKHHGKGTFQTR